MTTRGYVVRLDEAGESVFAVREVASPRIRAVAETETSLPSYEEAFVTHQRARAALDQIATVMRSMSLRPRMYGDALAVEMQAHAFTEVRRTLLGAPPDERPGPSKAGGVYPKLHRRRFGVNACSASSLLGQAEDADVEIGDFVGEWWRREQEAVADPEHDTRAEEERLAMAREKIAALPASARPEARRRMPLSWDRPNYAVEHYGCRIEGAEVVWSDGDRWPMAQVSVTVSLPTADNRLASASAFTFGPDPDHAIEMVRGPGQEQWRIHRLETRISAWNGSGWEYRGRKRWTFDEAWGECEHLVRDGIWPIGEARPWLSLTEEAPDPDCDVPEQPEGFPTPGAGFCRGLADLPHKPDVEPASDGTPQ